MSEPDSKILTSVLRSLPTHFIATYGKPKTIAFIKQTIMQLAEILADLGDE
jgi:hypothetical protein